MESGLLLGNESEIMKYSNIGVGSTATRQTFVTPRVCPNVNLRPGGGTGGEKKTCVVAFETACFFAAVIPLSHDADQGEESSQMFMVSTMQDIFLGLKLWDLYTHRSNS